MKQHMFWSLLLTFLFMAGLTFQTPEQTDILYKVVLFVVGMLAGAFWGTYLLMLGLLYEMLENKSQ